MDVTEEIFARVEKLPAGKQETVLRFVTSLMARDAKGESGQFLRSFSGSLDAASAEEMMRAIEETCERVDATEW